MAKKSNTSARWLAVVTVAFIFAITLAPPLQHWHQTRWPHARPWRTARSRPAPAGCCPPRPMRASHRCPAAPARAGRRHASPRRSGWPPRRASARPWAPARRARRPVVRHGRLQRRPLPRHPRPPSARRAFTPCAARPRR